VQLSEKTEDFESITTLDAKMQPTLISSYQPKIEVQG
jgi:hypothetical protein